MPLTFPSRQSNSKPNRHSQGFLRHINRFFSGLINTAYDIGCNLLKSSLIEDDKSPIRSGHGVECGPFAITTTTFSIEHIKQIKTKLQVTVNDVITGVIIFGTRLYMQRANQDSSKGNCTALVLLNTRAIGGYKSVSEMIKPNAEMPWGNRFAFLQVSIPNLTASELNNPLKFVYKASQLIKRQRNSAAVYLTGQFLDAMTKIRGPEFLRGASPVLVVEIPRTRTLLQQCNDYVTKTHPADVQNLEKFIHVERRAGNTSAVASAKILASLSNLRFLETRDALLEPVLFYLLDYQLQYFASDLIISHK
ncbi:uncharacterized protein LOC111379886 isoform X1 [Olea europaea var. sylvestris]|uniref:uncharacterized protein LOC111379886 isoform X1 n=1 Tax=Olea europaea var. sylvestris TaxID=158386 RepID=UPI000C1D2F40|nr:uncharacterized protein LOC111379886 isoform X1 [Olea europaea var. sylvestris]XP_022859096.1 uncharacterized protein LOC111379886 isoform X1 [Olea europaea var. sylvestris]